MSLISGSVIVSWSSGPVVGLFVASWDIGSHISSGVWIMGFPITGLFNPLFR